GSTVRVQGRGDPRGHARGQDVRRQAGEGAQRAGPGRVAAQGDHRRRGEGPRRTRWGGRRAGHLREARRV
ncbi:MAG: hypothetical protein AVDCRST_MAG83-2478, partial [uncultured Arthrobacter sp.]